MLIANIILSIMWLLVLLTQIFASVGGAAANWNISIGLTIILIVGTIINALRSYCVKTIKDYYSHLLEHAIADDEFELIDIYRDIIDKIQKMQ